MRGDTGAQCLVSKTVTLVIRVCIRETATNVENKDRIKKGIANEVLIDMGSHGQGLFKWSWHSSNSDKKKSDVLGQFRHHSLEN